MATRDNKYFECNYGEATLPLDKWFGTFRDGLPNGAGSKLKEEHRLEKQPFDYPRESASI